MIELLPWKTSDLVSLPMGRADNIHLKGRVTQAFALPHAAPILGGSSREEDPRCGRRAPEA
jgi:hypothetical protein